MRTDLQATVGSADFVGMLRMVRLRRLRAFTAITQAENVRNDVACPCRAAFGFHLESNLDVWLALRIRIVLWIFAKSLLTTG